MLFDLDSVSSIKLFRKALFKLTGSLSFLCSWVLEHFIFCLLGDQKFGRTDTSSPVPSSLNQAVTLPQPHLQQQAFINATTMPHPYGYGGLAFYPGAGMMAGGFPAYTAPMYQVNRIA